MARYKLVFEDIKQEGKEGFSVTLEDDNNQQIEKLEMDIEDVTPALEEVLSLWAQYQFTANQILDEDGLVVGGNDFNVDSDTQH